MRTLLRGARILVNGGLGHRSLHTAVDHIDRGRVYDLRLVKFDRVVVVLIDT